MASPTIKVGTELDPTGLQRGADQAQRSIQRFADKSGGALRNLSTQALGAAGPFKRIVDGMLEIGPAGKATAAVVSGIAVIKLAFDKLHQAQIETAQRQADVNAAFAGITVAQITAQQGAATGTLASLVAQQRVLKEQEQVLIQKLAPAYAQINNLNTKIVENQEKLQKGVISPAFAQAEERRLQGLQDAVKFQKNFADDFEKLAKNRADQVGIPAQIELATVQVLREQLGVLEEQRRVRGSLNREQQQTFNTLQQQLRQIAEAPTTGPAARAAAFGAAPTAVTPEQQRIEAQRKLQEELSKTKTEFDQLFALSINGTTLSAQQQERLNTLTEGYNTTLNDVNASLQQRVTALQVITTIENNAERLRAEALRKQKQLEAEVEEKRRNAIDAASDKLNNIQIFAMGAADALDIMFNAIGKGGGALAQLGVGILSLTSRLAKTKAAENIASAIEQFAKGIGAAAIGDVAAAATHKASATTFLKAAAAWAALGGGLGAGASAASANNRGAGTGGFSNSGLGSTPGGTGPIIITITGGGILDMNNPETARSFVNALNTVTNRRAIITTRA